MFLTLHYTTTAPQTHCDQPHASKPLPNPSIHLQPSLPWPYLTSFSILPSIQLSKCDKCSHVLVTGPIPRGGFVWTGKKHPFPQTFCLHLSADVLVIHRSMMYPVSMAAPTGGPCAVHNPYNWTTCLSYSRDHPKGNQQGQTLKPFELTYWNHVH